MRYFLDTEFVEDGETIKLLSIGIVSEDGREFYWETPLATSACVWPERFDPWHRENVIPHLRNDYEITGVASEIAEALLDFIGEDAPEFWGYYCDYDWVAVCQLFGRMIDLPKGWPMFCLDLKQVAYLGGIDLPKQKGTEHHALADARWVREAWQGAHP